MRCAGGKGLDAIGRPVVNGKMRVITLEFCSIGPLVQVLQFLRLGFWYRFSYRFSILFFRCLVLFFFLLGYSITTTPRHLVFGGAHSASDLFL